MELFETVYTDKCNNQQEKQSAVTSGWPQLVAFFHLSSCRSIGWKVDKDVIVLSFDIIIEFFTRSSFSSAKSPAISSLHTPETGTPGDPSTVNNVKLMNSVSARLLYKNQLLHLSGLRTPKSEVKTLCFHPYVYILQHLPCVWIWHCQGFSFFNTRKLQQKLQNGDCWTQRKLDHDIIGCYSGFSLVRF